MDFKNYGHFFYIRSLITLVFKLYYSTICNLHETHFISETIGSGVIIIICIANGGGAV